MAILFQGKYGFTVKSLVWWIRMTATGELQEGRGLDTPRSDAGPLGRCC